MRFTIFTPTYNRAYIIEHLYHSLQRQTFKDFEWIVVNDGSTDDTDKLFDKLKKEKNEFPLRYYSVSNGGKHRAINKGVKLARGELFFIVDSDDYLTDDALEVADKAERSIHKNGKKNFCGICGLRGNTPQKMIGNTYAGDGFLDITALERQKYNISGDKAEIFYTDILRRYPFPEFEGEKFVTEDVVWHRIAYDGYSMRYFNQIIYICDYLPDGLSAKYDKLLIENPKGYGLYLNQEISYGILNGLLKWQKILNYYYNERDHLSIIGMAKNLKMNAVNLYFRLLFMRLFYKVYDN